MKRIFLAIAVIAVATSCKKDKDDCELNGTSIQGAYKTVAIKYKASTGATEVDEFATYDACEKDDLVILNADNTVTFQDAGVSCVPPFNDTGIWSLSSNSLNIDGEIYTVTAFDCSGMTLVNYGTTAGEMTTVTVVKQ